MADKVIYEEVQEAKLVKVISYVFIFLSFLILLASYGLENQEAVVGSVFTAIFLGGIGLFLLKTMANLKVKLTNTHLDIAFGNRLFYAKIPLEDIDVNSVEVKPIPKIYGIGLRYDFKGNVIFNTRFGKGLQFKQISKNKYHSVVAKDNERLLKELKKQINIK